MEAIIKLNDDLFQKLKNRSEERGMPPEELAKEILEHDLSFSEEENRIFEQRTREALERVENNPNRKRMNKKEFIEELESW